MLGCIERESLNCSHDQNWEEIGDAPLELVVCGGHGRNPHVLEAEIPRSWCQKDFGASGASQVPFSVFRKWSGLETAARTIFENQACLVNIFKVVVVYQTSCVTTRCCQTLLVNWKGYTLEHELDRNEPFVHRQVSCAKVDLQLPACHRNRACFFVY